MRDYSNTQYSNQPLQGSVVDLVTQHEQGIQRNRMMKLEQDKFEYNKADRDRTWRENFLKDNLKQQDFIDVNDADLNSLYAKTVTNAMNEAGEIAMKLAYGKGTPEDRVRLHQLNQTADKLKAVSGPVSEVIKKLNEGAVHDDKDVRAYLKSLGNATIEITPKGEFELVIPSENGESKRIPYNEAMKGVEGFGLVPKIDVYKGVDELAKGIDVVKNSTYKGYEDITTEGINPDYAKEVAQNYLFGANGTTLTNAAKSALKSAGFDPYNLNEEGVIYLQELSGDLANRIVNSKKQVSETKLDRASKDRASALAETARHNKVSEGISQQKVNIDAKNAESKRMEVNHKIKETGITYNLAKPDSPAFVSVGKKSELVNNSMNLTKGIEMGVMETGKSGKSDQRYNDVIIHYISYTKDGRIVLDMEGKVDGEEKTKSRVGFVGNKTTESQVAAKLGMTPEQLKESIVGGGSQTTSITDTSKYN